MAQIDLRNATIYIKDGYNGPGTVPFTVDNMSGYALAAVTMIVKDGVGIIKVGDRFTVAGDTVVHTVSAHSETMGNTTSITFAPGLGAMVVDDAIITLLPHLLEVKIGEGNMTYSEKRTYKYTKDRGTLDTVKEEDDEPMEVRIDAIWEFIKADTDQIPTIEDALKQRGEAAHWESSSDDPCEPYAVDIVVLYVPPCSEEENEEIICPDFRWESFEHDLRAATFSIQGKCNSKEAIVTRGATGYPE